MNKIARKLISLLSILLLLVQSLVTPFLVSPVYAATSPWTQTDWSTGDFASSANVTTGTAGQVTLATTEKLTNGGFATGTEGGVADNWGTATVSAPPAGYVEVPSNALYANPATYDATQPSKSNFLAMQYEAKYDCTATPDGDGDTAATCSAAADSGAGLDYRDIVGFTTSRVVSTANGAPIVHITQTQAISACPTGHLITNNEWMTIARNAEAQTTNWANGTIGSTVASGGGLKRGNVGIADSASYNGADPEQGTGRDTKAKFTLSNSSELWDLSGNVWEWNSDTITEANQPDVSGQSGFAWRELTALTSYGTLSYDLVRPLGSTYDANYGVGRIYHNSGSAASTVYAFLRGGHWSSGAYAGVFSLHLDITPGLQFYSVGFRCASDPVAISQSFSSSSGRSAGGGDTITIGSISNGKLYQSVNVGDTASYYIQAYVKMAVGSDPITSSVATLYYGGNTISNAAYTEVVGETGWYKLTGTVTGVASGVDTGLLVKASKTVIVDDLSVYNYDDSGTLTSSIFDSEFASGAAWGALTYTATTPGSTSVTVKARSSNSATMTGAPDFSTCDAITSASDISGNNCVTDSHRYIQYQLTAATTDPLVTPTFADISIAFAAYDATAPSISLTALSPDPGSDNTPTLSGTATDATSTVSSVQFQMDSTAGSWTACTAGDGAFDEASEAFTCTVAVALSDGSHTMNVRATDSLSNTTSSGSETTDTFTIDTVSTTLSLTAISPDPGTDTTPTLTGTATDATSLVSAVQFQMDSTSGSWTACTADDGTFNESSEAFTCPVTTALSDGTHTLYVRATDNAGNTSANASDSFTVDTTGPVSKDLDYPADGSYINSVRPTFKWKAFSDATSGLSNYKLEVTRADSDTNTENTGFTIDGIEVSRTTTYSTSRYNIEYENFSDTDSSNNYLKATTKSSSDWGSGNNDGKLKQGKYTWKVTATDAVGNTVTSSKTFYVDLTNPALTATVDGLGEADGYTVVTDLKPEISGSFTDNYAVDKIEFAFYKQNFFFGVETARSLYTLETVNHPDSATTSWSYSFSPSQHLDYGKYQLEMKGYDRAGNAAPKITSNLQVLTDSAARSALLKNAANKAKVIEKIRARTKISLPELEKQAKIRRQTEAANLTKFVDSVREGIVSLWQQITDGSPRMFAFTLDIAQGIGNRSIAFLQNMGESATYVGSMVSAHISRTVSAIATGTGDLYNRLPRTLAAVLDVTIIQPVSTINRLAQQTQVRLSESQEKIREQTIAVNTEVSDSAAHLSRGTGEWFTKVNRRLEQAIDSRNKAVASMYESASDRLARVGEAWKLAMLSLQKPANDTTGYFARAKIWLLTFHAVVIDPNATRIEYVYLEEIGRDYVVVSWETNHYTKNNKINYGKDLTYGQSAFTDDYTKLHVVRLEGLEPGTEYFFEVMSQNKNYAYDAYYRFETKK